MSIVIAFSDSLCVLERFCFIHETFYLAQTTIIFNTSNSTVRLTDHSWQSSSLVYSESVPVVSIQLCYCLLEPETRAQPEGTDRASTRTGTPAETFCTAEVMQRGFSKAKCTARGRSATDERNVKQQTALYLLEVDGKKKKRIRLDSCYRRSPGEKSQL